jgi:hypothetical protein
LRWSRLGIKNLNQLIFIIKNWSNDAHDECDGPLKPKYMVDFLTFEASFIEKHKKMLEQHDLFEETSNKV